MIRSFWMRRSTPLWKNASTRSSPRTRPSFVWSCRPRAAAAHRRAEAYPRVATCVRGPRRGPALGAAEAADGLVRRRGRRTALGRRGVLLSQTTRVRRTRFGGLPCACVDEDATRRSPPFTKGAPRARVTRAPRRDCLKSETTRTSTRRSTRATGARRSALPTRGGSGDELFRVVGYVDAVSPDSDDSIVIEVKNRMHQVRAPEL